MDTEKIVLRTGLGILAIIALRACYILATNLDIVAIPWQHWALFLGFDVHYPSIAEQQEFTFSQGFAYVVSILASLAVHFVAALFFAAVVGEWASKKSREQR